MSQIKVGIIGAGRGGRAILEILSAMKEVQVAGVCDVKPDAPGVVLAHRLKVRVFHDFRELLR